MKVNTINYDSCSSSFEIITGWKQICKLFSHVALKKIMRFYQSWELFFARVRGLNVFFSVIISYFAWSFPQWYSILLRIKSVVVYFLTISEKMFAKIQIFMWFCRHISLCKLRHWLFFRIFTVFIIFSFMTSLFNIFRFMTQLKW